MTIFERRRWIPDDMAPLAPPGAERVLERWPEGLNVRERREVEPDIVAWLDAENRPLVVRTRRRRGAVKDLTPSIRVGAPEGARTYVQVFNATLGHDFAGEPDRTLWFDAEGEEIR